MKRRVIKGFRYGDAVYAPQYKLPWYKALLTARWDWYCYTRVGSEDPVMFSNLEKAKEYRGPGYEVVWEEK